MEEEVEARPDLFIRRTYAKRLEDVRAHLARLVHADLSEIVMVPNATLGINTILRNIEWSRDDIIIQCQYRSLSGIILFHFVYYYTKLQRHMALYHLRLIIFATAYPTPRFLRSL